MFRPLGHLLNLADFGSNLGDKRIEPVRLLLERYDRPRLVDSDGLLNTTKVDWLCIKRPVFMPEIRQLYSLTKLRPKDSLYAVVYVLGLILFHDSDVTIRHQSEGHIKVRCISHQKGHQATIHGSRRSSKIMRH